MEVFLHLPTGTQVGFGVGGRRGDPGEWQNPTASPRGHDEGDDDETLSYAGKGLCSNHSQGPLLRQPLPHSGHNFQNQLFRAGFALSETAPLLLQQSLPFSTTSSFMFSQFLFLFLASFIPVTSFLLS